MAGMARLWAFVFIAFALPALLCGSAAAGEATLEVVSPDEAALSPAGVAPVLETGSLLIFGRIDDPSFSIAGPDQVTVIASGGRQVPLLIDEKSIFREFGNIVSMKIAFTAAESELAAGDLLLRWGPDVCAANVAGGEISSSGIAGDRLRQFRIMRTASGAEPPSVATIQVIADSHAGWYFLWYLLPISVIFALLTIRKIRARRSQ